MVYLYVLKAYFHGGDWINRAIHKNMIRQTSFTSFYIELCEDDKDLTLYVQGRNMIRSYLNAKFLLAFSRQDSVARANFVMQKL